MFQGEEKRLTTNHKMLARSSKNSRPTLKLICLESKSIAKSQEFSNVHSPFSSCCTRLFLLGWGLWGWGWGGKNIKGQKWLIFPIFVLVKGVCGGRASEQGRAKCPMSALPFFFPEKHQTLHDLSLGNCMHGYEMIIVVV